MEKCLECENGNTCTKCEIGYGLKDDDNNCVDITKNEYFLDGFKYKLCSSAHELTNCKKCLKNELNIVNCIECSDTTYSIIHGELDKCELKSNYQNRDDMYTNDEGKNYYPCNNKLYHSVDKCIECNNKETCEKCQDGYLISNSNKVCLSNNDILEKKYFKDPNDNNYYLCSQKMQGCVKCESGNACIECDYLYKLDINDKCVHTFLINN